MTSVDVIIVTYESSRHVAGAIAGLKASDEVGRVIVVDNASSDGSAEAARRAGADVVRQNDHNVGFARAVDIGLRDVRGDFVLLHNPDARIAPAALSRLRATLKREPGAAIVAPLLRHDGYLSTGAGRSATVVRRVGLCIPLVGRAPRFRPEYAPPADKWAVARVVDVDYVFGAAMLLDRAFFATVGGLDERFFLFAEDEDICRRAHAAGRRVILDGGAVADHIGGASCADRAVTEAQRLFSTYRLLDKWDGSGRAAVYHCGILAAFRLRTTAARVVAGIDGRRPAGHGTLQTDGAALCRATAAELRRTSALFDAAVRTGIDPLEPRPGGLT